VTGEPLSLVRLDRAAELLDRVDVELDAEDWDISPTFLRLEVELAIGYALVAIASYLQTGRP
jgi:hypothetical protein